MRYSSHAGLEDISAAGEILTGLKMLETVRGAKFGRFSRVCRRTCGSRNGLHKIPENESVDFRRMVCLPQMELIQPSKGHVAPPGTNATTNEASRKRSGGFWKVFKSKSGGEKRKNHNLNHHVDASSLLNFV